MNSCLQNDNWEKCIQFLLVSYNVKVPMVPYLILFHEGLKAMVKKALIILKKYWIEIENPGKKK